MTEWKADKRYNVRQDRVADLVSELRQVHPNIDVLGDAADTIEAQAQHIEKLRSALEFYASAAAYKLCEGEYEWTVVQADNGKGAREALEVDG
jgi:hypothetical protein